MSLKQNTNLIEHLIERFEESMEEESWKTAQSIIKTIRSAGFPIMAKTLQERLDEQLPQGLLQKIQRQAEELKKLLQ